MHKECQDLLVAYLTNNVTSHSIPLLNSISSQVKELIVLTSTPPEQNAIGNLKVEGRFQIIRQRRLSLRRVRHHPQGYSQEMDIHFPYDTLLQLIVRRPDATISLEFGLRTLQALIYRLLNPSNRLIVWAPVSERTEQGRGKLREMIRKLILRKADAILVNGSSGFRYFRQLGAGSRKIFKVPYTTDIELFGSISPTRPQDKMHRLLYVGQLIELKGLIFFVKNLIQWLGRHPTKTVEFVLIGEGPVRQQLEALQLPDTLTLSFLGKINYRDLPSYYAKAGVLVFPTLGDEWGLVVNEAMMTGLPVLGSIYSQAVEEMVKDGINGWIFTSDDPQSTYQALDHLLTVSYADLEKMRVQARRAASKLSPEYAARQIIASLGAIF
jgi:glycosyltransferase involved in cell wall biosynthesis